MFFSTIDFITAAFLLSALTANIYILVSYWRFSRGNCSSAPTKVGFQSAIDASHKCVVFQTLKAIVTPESLLVLDFRGLGLERWLVLDLASQLASQTHSLPFEFRALEAILQHKAR